MLSGDRIAHNATQMGYPIHHEPKDKGIPIISTLSVYINCSFLLLATPADCEKSKQEVRSHVKRGSRLI